MSTTGSRAAAARTAGGGLPHVHPWRRRVSAFGDRVVNADPLTVQGHPVAFIASTSCVVDLRVVDEPEAA